ncbi:M1 family metallopeptidase [Flagellimonas algicola]|uniref:Aminopeptidase N n=1 Tax=Flagellimonas algicola TaxID=2583815 RepID=A0ABY2WPI5_9FLAO|nr:M1 family metallopeptidase [Allomuricauda algicola]TMU56675.1 M1 family metallopeptidase [Allomuricauda algicola]
MKLAPVLIFFLLTQLLSSQIQDKVDFVRGQILVQADFEQAKIQGSVDYYFKILKPVDSIFLDAKEMKFEQVQLNGKPINYKTDGQHFVVKKQFRKDDHHLKFNYSAFPKQTVYFIGDGDTDKKQMWTQGQGKYTSHWLPSLDDMNDKIEFDLTIVADQSQTVISNGELEEIVPQDGINVWRFDMEQPMSSYLVAFAMGNFEKEILHSKKGIPIELYYEPKDSLCVEPTYRHTQRMFDFLADEIGVPYPWQNYKQIPVQDFLYAGMENTGATIFSNTFMVDSTAFIDKNFVNVNAHELAHQWFGNLVTEQSGSHHWLHEGFATFYAYLAEKDIFGEDYFYWRLLETAKALDNFSGDGHGEALTNASAGSLTFYEKGAWALVILRDRVGDMAFREGIQNYLTKFAFQNVTISDFMWEMEKASGMKLSSFEEAWLQESDFPFEKVKLFLRAKNTSIDTYFKAKEEIGDKPENAETVLGANWKTYLSEALKHQLLLDYGNQLSPQFLNELLKQEGLKVRQAISLAMEKVPLEVRAGFEGLLGDQSYTTVEAALFKLWTDFPENRNVYLDQTANIVGFPNKNVRLLWLTLALVTADYAMDKKPDFYNELSSYTGSEYHFEVRLLAFQYLKSIGAFNDDTLKSLIKACSHHVWHFKKSCRKMLKDFLKAEGNLARVKAIYPTLNLEQQRYLDKTLGK